MEQTNPVTEPTNQQANSGRLAMLKSELRSAISDMRAANNPDCLRCRPLSEAITCAETAYLWLCQVEGEDGEPTLLEF